MLRVEIVVKRSQQFRVQKCENRNPFGFILFTDVRSNMFTVYIIYNVPSSSLPHAFNSWFTHEIFRT